MIDSMRSNVVSPYVYNNCRTIYVRFRAQVDTDAYLAGECRIVLIEHLRIRNSASIGEIGEYLPQVVVTLAVAARLGSTLPQLAHAVRQRVEHAEEVEHRCATAHGRALASDNARRGMQQRTDSFQSLGTPRLNLRSSTKYISLCS